jgi:7SK snRNA methylphosphate capping enzyme
MSVVPSSITSQLKQVVTTDEDTRKRKLEGTEPNQQEKRRRLDSASNRSHNDIRQNNPRRYKDRVYPQRKKSNATFEHGNYWDYYGYRNKGYHGLDPRLEVLDPSWFSGAKCLDVGCNAGIFTLDLAVLFDIESVLGIDIDNKLINKAKGNLTKYVRIYDFWRDKTVNNKSKEKRIYKRESNFSGAETGRSNVQEKDSANFFLGTKSSQNKRD